MFKQCLYITVFAVLALTQTLEASSHQQEYLLTRVEHAQLFKRNIHAIVQDQTGFVWFATDNGLLRFDGNDVAVFRHNPENEASLPSNMIRSAHIDGNGNLWVGSTPGALSLYKPETNDFEHFRPEPFRNYDIRSISSGSDNTLWIGSIRDPYIYRFSLATREFEKIPIPVQNDRNALFAFDILETSTGDLWLATVEDGVIVLDSNMQQIAGFIHNPDDTNSLNGNSLKRITEDHYGNIWIGGFGASVSKFDPSQGIMSSPNRLMHNWLNNVYDFWVDEDNDVIWVAADGGLIVIDIHTVEIIEVYGYNPTETRSLTNDRPRAIHQDHGGIIWIGNEHGGLHKLLKRNAFTHTVPETGNRNRLQHRTVRSFLELNENELWVVNDTDIAVVDPATNIVRRIIRTIPGKKPEDGISVIKPHPEGGYLIGTWGSGLIHYNPATGLHKSYRTISGDSTSISDNRIQLIHFDSQGRLWVGTQNGLNLFDSTTDRFSRVLFDSSALAGTYSYSIQSGAFIEHDDDIFWIGTWSGLLRLDMKTGVYSRITNVMSPMPSLQSSHVISLHLCDNNYLWVGTFGGGLSRLDTKNGSVFTLTDTEGLSSSVIFTIVAGDDSTIWLSTNNGLIRFNTVSLNFRNFNETDGLGISEFWWGAGYRAPSGKMYFGSIFGYVSFNPEDIQESEFNPPVVLSELRLFEQLIPVRTALRLAYFENYLSFNYASLDFTNPASIEYMHKLEGLDADWISTGNRSQVSYSSIPPGTYTFRVRATNGDGIWGSNELSVPIKIIPPFWQTTSFHVMIFLFLGLCVYGTILWRTASISDRNRTLEAQVAKRIRELARNQEELSQSNEALLEKSERLEERNSEIEAQKNQLLESAYELMHKNDELEQINQEKNSLLGIVAHDLRSPLVSVVSGLEIIRMTPDMSRDEIDTIHNMMNGSINKQLALIGRILEHQSLESGTIALNRVQQSVIPTLKNVIQTHDNRAKEKNLTVRLNKPPQISGLPLDSSVFEQVMDNLLSNAIKFSHPNGTITITVLDTHSEIWTGVKDNGPGISDADRAKLFGKFQKLSARPTGGEESTGLGLSIVKRLTEEMNGRVWCESTLGESATFWIALPKVID